MTKFLCSLMGLAMLLGFATAVPHSASAEPTPGQVAYALQAYGFGRLTTTGVEYPQDDIRITAATAGVPDMCAALVGAHHGKLSNGRPFLVVVTTVTGTAKCRATVWVSWGSEPGKPVKITGPWTTNSKGVYRRSGRNMPVGKMLTASIDHKDGTLSVTPIKSRPATMKLSGGNLRVTWGSAKAVMRGVDLATIQFVQPVGPAVASRD